MPIRPLSPIQVLVQVQLYGYDRLNLIPQRLQGQHESPAQDIWVKLVNDGSDLMLLQFFELFPQVS